MGVINNMGVINTEGYILSALGSLSGPQRLGRRRITTNCGRVVPRRHWGLPGPPRRVIAEVFRLTHPWP